MSCSANSRQGCEAVLAYSPGDVSPDWTVPSPAPAATPPPHAPDQAKVTHSFPWVIRLPEVSQSLKTPGWRIVKLHLHLPFTQKPSDENALSATICTLNK